MLVPAALNIALNFILLPRMGLMGAVVATVAAYAAAVLLLSIAGRRHVALPVPWADLAKICAAAFAMWPVIALLPSPGGWTEVFLKAACGAATYAIILFLLNAGGIRSFVRQRP